MTDYLWLALGAAVGAPARYLTDRAVQARVGTTLPWGTLAVNVVGSFVLGVLVGWGTTHDVPDAVVLAVGTGFCGALTTYSTFAYETVRLLESGRWRGAAVNVGLSLVAGVGAAVVGYLLA
ncbi:fluoride efflux transporter CrcB [Nocardioides sp. C4-1]|uniref:fluoride efflux transporter CrcB n=1 Tax=Nocardioides sp. C4-1 TaxID=3151851 RepID=UPI0032633F0C